MCCKWDRDGFTNFCGRAAEKAGAADQGLLTSNAYVANIRAHERASCDYTPVIPP
jgi:hypothetical protein